MTELNEIKIVHIGLGKTATSTLQIKILPEICYRLNIELLDVDNFIRKDQIISNKKKCHPLEDSNNIDLPKRFLILLKKKIFLYLKKINSREIINLICIILIISN